VHSIAGWNHLHKIAAGNFNSRDFAGGQANEICQKTTYHRCMSYYQKVALLVLKFYDHRL